MLFFSSQEYSCSLFNAGTFVFIILCNHLERNMSGETVFNQQTKYLGKLLSYMKQLIVFSQPMFYEKVSYILIDWKDLKTFCNFKTKNATWRKVSPTSVKESFPF